MEKQEIVIRDQDDFIVCWVINHFKNALSDHLSVECGRLIERQSQ